MDHLAHRDLKYSDRHTSLIRMLELSADDRSLRSYSTLRLVRDSLSLNGGMYLDGEEIEDLKVVLPNLVVLVDRILDYLKNSPDTLVKCLGTR